MSERMVRTRFKIIKECNGAYYVGSDGSVWTTREWAGISKPYKVGGKWKKMAQAVHHSGYLQVTLARHDGTKRSVFVHRLIAIAFLGHPPTSDHEVAHNNGVRSDNRIANLRWATSKENIADRKVHGTEAWGERSGVSRLTESHVREILQCPDIACTVLARRFGVDKATILRVRWGHTWAWLTGIKRQQR